MTFNDIIFKLGSLLTGAFSRTARLAVDAQQTSYEENRQFKFFDDNTDADAVSAGNILIYRVSCQYPSSLLRRVINGYAGGRKYIVYPYIGSETITGGNFVDVTASKLSAINNDLSVSGLSSHPVSGWTIEKRLATAFTTTAPKRTGTMYKSDGNNARQTSSYTADGNRSGIAAGNQFLLVFTDIGSGSDASEFLFQLDWEEVFPKSVYESYM